MSSAKIEVWQNTNKEWFWHLKARNGQVVADAEVFPSRANAIRAAKGHVRNVVGGKHAIEWKQSIGSIEIDGASDHPVLVLTWDINWL